MCTKRIEIIIIILRFQKYYIEDRSKQYLELSCNIIEWFKENYKITDDIKDILKVKDLFDTF